MYHIGDSHHDENADPDACDDDVRALKVRLLPEFFCHRLLCNVTGEGMADTQAQLQAIETMIQAFSNILCCFCIFRPSEKTWQEHPSISGAQARCGEFLSCTTLA